MTNIGDLMRSVNAGETGAQDALFAAAYGELRKLARARLRHGGRNTVLDTTALVHESYLRFIKGGHLRSEDRRAFFAYMSRVMRTVIVDAVRERKAERRGGDLQRMTLNTEIIDGMPSAEDQILDIDAALDVLAKADERLARVVEMRYFAGCTEVEIAEALGVTERTVRRDWDKAKKLLKVMLQQD
jgi:RNA polymerase sigma factor (TIGR02999 family)